MDYCVKQRRCVYLITTFHNNINYKNNVSLLTNKMKASLDNIYLHYEQ